MDKIMPIVNWIRDNYINVFYFLAAVVSTGELLVRIIPTMDKKGLLERIGAFLQRIMDFLKIPNNTTKV
jgi:hypothetical protein